jgi:hypothetical protein
VVSLTLRLHADMAPMRARFPLLIAALLVACLASCTWATSAPVQLHAPVLKCSTKVGPLYRGLIAQAGTADPAGAPFGYDMKISDTFNGAKSANPQCTTSTTSSAKTFMFEMRREPVDVETDVVP